MILYIAEYFCLFTKSLVTMGAANWASRQAPSLLFGVLKCSEVSLAKHWLTLLFKNILTEEYGFSFLSQHI